MNIIEVSHDLAGRQPLKSIRCWTHADARPFPLPFLLPARRLGRLVRQIGAAIQAENIAGPRTLRWCDSTERELTDDLLDPRGISFTVD